MMCYSGRFPSQMICFAGFRLRTLLIYRYLRPYCLSIIMSKPIPPGVNLDDDRSSQLIKSVVACYVLSGLAVAGRLASRKIKKSKFKASDYLVTAGLLGSWVVSSITIIDGEQWCFNSQRRHFILTPSSG